MTPIANTTPIRKVPLGPSDAIFEYRADGAILIHSPHTLSPYPTKLTERLVHWARETPERTFLAQRDASGAWRTLNYAQTLGCVRSIGQALIDRKLSADRPVAILSGNDLEHALLALAAMHVGVLYAPISPAYSLISTDHAKLRYILKLLTPGLVFSSHGEQYAKAIADASRQAQTLPLPRLRWKAGKRPCFANFCRPLRLRPWTGRTPWLVPKPLRKSCSRRAPPASPRA
jgi:feruloyl-CoA synthase